MRILNLLKNFLFNTTIHVYKARQNGKEGHMFTKCEKFIPKEYVVTSLDELEHKDINSLHICSECKMDVICEFE